MDPEQSSSVDVGPRQWHFAISAGIANLGRIRPSWDQHSAGVRQTHTTQGQVHRQKEANEKDDINNDRENEWDAEDTDDNDKYRLGGRMKTEIYLARARSMPRTKTTAIDPKRKKALRKRKARKERWGRERKPEVDKYGE